MPLVNKINFLLYFLQETYGKNNQVTNGIIQDFFSAFQIPTGSSTRRDVELISSSLNNLDTYRCRGVGNRIVHVSSIFHNITICFSR